MAPRKKFGSSSSSKKSNQNNRQSQPSKFGIEHFFERHTQNAAQSASQNAQIPKSSQTSDPKNPSQSTPPANLPTIPAATVIAFGNQENAREDSPPDVSKSVPLKRFKFSPGMLIKQSQDDGGDEITWKISPVNERLQAVSKHLPEMMRALADASKLNALNFHKCSQKQSPPGSVGKLETWLSSPPPKAPERSVIVSKKLCPKGVEQEQAVEFQGSCLNSSDWNNTGAVKCQSPFSPFRTPPSMSFCPDDTVNDSMCKETCDQPGLWQHRKALLELLDQVEDVISVEESVTNDLEANLSLSQENRSNEISVEVDTAPKTLAKCTPQRFNRRSSEHNFLVLEVYEKHKTGDSSGALSPFKVIRLLNEQRGEEQALHLCDEWFNSIIGPGDTIHVIGEFDKQGKCVVDHDNNLVIVLPDIVVSGTRVAASFSCPRRTVLDERLKCSEHSTPALIGTLLHQIFQAGLLKELPTKDFLEEYARIVLQKNVESLYACGVKEKDMLMKLIEAIPRILNWLISFRHSQKTELPAVAFGSNGGEEKVTISEIIDIEEMAWAPRYGLKGMIDASVRVKIDSETSGAEEKIMPLEFKTGKGTTGQSAMEHSAQVILYTLLMSERYLKHIDSGLLYYLHTDQTQGVLVRRSDLVGLIMRRNELAKDILKASTTQQLPPMLQNPNMCKGCRHLNVCTIYHKANGGNTESSGLGDIFDTHVKHLSGTQLGFLKKWDRLIDLEAKEMQAANRKIWRSLGLRSEHSSGLSSVILDASDKLFPTNCPKDGRYLYRFVRQDLPNCERETDNGETLNAVPSPIGNLDCTLRSGDHVIFSTESSRVAVANGVITDISRFHVSVSFPRRLRLPGSKSSSEVGDLLQEVWRIDKDEFTTSFAIMRFNLIQLFVQSAEASRLRNMIVDIEAPRFDSAGIFSQDPAISYVRSEKSLNKDQRRAIQKILTAKDYALILGMPGTGKTSTMVHAVKALLMRDASILLTSYTNSAVDNLLIKLKAQGIDFVRIGRYEAVHEEVRDHCFSETGACSVEDIKLRLAQVNVIAVTCLGITHPLLANRRFDVCIMDEAGQITLPVSLGPLMFASIFVLVGDHYQLPPLVQSTEARENEMGISLFCRLSEAHPQAISALQCQVLDPNKPVIFINTDMLPALEVKDQKTVNNPSEACIVAEIIDELVNKGVSEEDIGIITPYNSQANFIRRVVCAAFVEIHTIDKYQGRDKDCILVSFVRSTDNPRACKSSLLGDWQRINVSLTRAKKKLILVGSCKTLSNVPLLKLLIEKVDEQSGIFCISQKDFHQSGKLKRCSQKLNVL
ncbi:DNA replication ATP-dependent helicase/nuclease JHS1 isoform X2 [Macadamia integrifolia]|uniref:DNA replication ATP-dependent helicase/nuclease JHS1 isoform X2 n=1 Tax=Macadamia integrifolia TaxID=60698 RepID=UPI001C4ED1A8|nr:DNA replication ATP-dependent helicase/nuclease JHS1 isoform X2 [Macadamia integrifolia]